MMKKRDFKQCVIGLEGCLHEQCRYFEGGECAYRPGVKNDGKEKASSTQGKSAGVPRQRFYEAKETLTTKGVVEIRGELVSVR